MSGAAWLVLAGVALVVAVAVVLWSAGQDWRDANDEGQ